MELTLLKIKTFLAKALSFVKLYWKEAFFLAALAYLVFFIKKKNDLINELISQRERSRIEHIENIDRLNQQIQSEVAIRRKIESDFQALIDRIKKDHADEVIRIASVRAEEIKRLIRRYQNNPVVMAQSINELFGIPVMPVSDVRQPWEPDQ